MNANQKFTLCMWGMIFTFFLIFVFGIVVLEMYQTRKMAAMGFVEVQDNRATVSANGTLWQRK